MGEEKPAKLSLFYSPIGSLEEAKTLAKALVSEKLVACVNIHGPHLSIYPWKGEIQEDQEWTLILKMLPENSAALKTWLEKNHPYETPAILNLGEVEANTEFFDWVNEVLMEAEK